MAVVMLMVSVSDAPILGLRSVEWVVRERYTS